MSGFMEDRGCISGSTSSLYGDIGSNSLFSKHCLFPKLRASVTNICPDIIPASLITYLSGFSIIVGLSILTQGISFIASK